MTKNEIIARWLGYRNPKLPGPNLNYETLHEAWVKFRDLKPEGMPFNLVHPSYCNKIADAIVNKSITEAFDELVKGIEWYQSLNQK